MAGLRESCLLIIMLYVGLCHSRSPDGSYSRSSSRSNNHDTSSEDASERGRDLLSDVFTRPRIPDYTVTSQLTDIYGSVTTHFRNFEISNVQIGSTARFTKIDDVTAEFVTSDFSFNIRADWETSLSSFFFTFNDVGTISYQLNPASLTVVYSYEEGPPAELKYNDCIGNIVFSQPTITADTGESWIYRLVINEIKEDTNTEVTAEICKLFDQERNAVVAASLQSYLDMFQIKCPLVPHATFVDCPMTPNSACALDCEDGYVTSSSLVPRNILICKRDGYWNVPADSVCEVTSCETSGNNCAGEGETCINDAPSGFHCECQDAYIRNSDDTGCIVVEEILHFVVRPTDVTVEEGAFVQLVCRMNSDEASQFWFRGTQQLLSRNLEEGLYVTSGSLTFLNTELKHAGNYTCIVRSPRGQEIRASASLSVLPAGTITTVGALFYPVFIKRPEDTALVLGGIAIFHCEVDVVTAEVNWYKDGIKITDGINGIILLRDNKLVITNTEIYHQGVYTCVITSSDGSRAEADARAYFSTGYVFDSLPSDATVFDGEIYHLSCSSSIPTLELSWFKDGTPLAYSERIFKLGEDVLLRDVTADDSGLYVCVAADSEGHTIAQAAARIDVLSHNLNDHDCGIVTSSEVIEAANSRGLMDGRVIGGHNAERGSAPWMARLVINGPRKSGHVCGGSLIDRQWVVTAAHCFYTRDGPLDTEHLFIRLGDHDTLNYDNAEMSVLVEATYQHEDFDRETFNNDIALVKLATPLSYYTDYIRPICLANRTTARQLLVDGASGRVNGWGVTIEGGVGSVYLQEVYLPFKTYRKCKKSFRNKEATFTRNMICAGYARGGADACQGDSGGPYAIEETNRWYLTGIVSWGLGCGKADSYGVYTRYSKYHEWVTGIINNS